MGEKGKELINEKENNTSIYGCYTLCYYLDELPVEKIIDVIVECGNSNKWFYKEFIGKNNSFKNEYYKPFAIDGKYTENHPFYFYDRDFTVLGLSIQKISKNDPFRLFIWLADIDDANNNFYVESDSKEYLEELRKSLMEEFSNDYMLPLDKFWERIQKIPNLINNR